MTTEEERQRWLVESSLRALERRVPDFEAEDTSSRVAKLAAAQTDPAWSQWVAETGNPAYLRERIARARAALTAGDLHAAEVEAHAIRAVLDHLGGMIVRPLIAAGAAKAEHARKARERRAEKVKKKRRKVLKVFDKAVSDGWPIEAAKRHAADKCRITVRSVERAREDREKTSDTL